MGTTFSPTHAGFPTLKQVRVHAGGSTWRISDRQQGAYTVGKHRSPNVCRLLIGHLHCLTGTDRMFCISRKLVPDAVCSRLLTVRRHL
jgi:hypothetical protein